MAEICSKEGLLIGDFFFFRATSLRNNAERLATSLTYQLAQTIPSTLSYIATCIQGNPVIFESSLEAQLQRLCVEPLQRACAADPTMDPRPRLLILDGLDECDTPKSQKHILAVQGRLFKPRHSLLSISSPADLKPTFPQYSVLRSCSLKSEHVM